LAGPAKKFLVPNRNVSNLSGVDISNQNAEGITDIYLFICVEETGRQVQNSRIFLDWGP
jgi:hypothetical protein